MSASEDSAAPTGAIDILGQVWKKGVKLWADNGHLRYRAPKGALTREEIERLASSKEQILLLLEELGAAPTSEPLLEPRQPCAFAPLTFAQLAHWRLNRLHERSSVRQVASAIGVRGPLDVQELDRSLAAVVARHEALRTRIVMVDGIPMQQILESAHAHLPLMDFSDVESDARGARLAGLIEQVVLEPVHLDAYPLFAVHLARFAVEEHVLIIAMEHMISDGVSVNILVRDLFAHYAQVSCGGPPLPRLPIQFADYAVWQSATQSTWVQRHSQYWRERFAECQPLRFPEHRTQSAEDLRGWGSVPVRIDAGLRNELLEWRRARRTTLVMSVLTAYAALILRWCNTSEALLRYQTDGRADPLVGGAIGYFASVLHLRLQLRASDTFVDLLQQIMQEYRSAHAHADFSYLDAHILPDALMRSPGFNWVPQEPRHDLTRPDESPHQLRFFPVPFDSPVLRNYKKDAEPTILFYEFDQQIVGSLLFQRARFADETMRKFVDNFFCFLRTLLQQPDKRINDIALL